VQGYIDGRLRSFERLTIHEDVIRDYVSLLTQRGDFAVTITRPAAMYASQARREP
jgi:hypothetical protein